MSTQSDTKEGAILNDSNKILVSQAKLQLINGKKKPVLSNLSDFFQFLVILLQAA